MCGTTKEPGGICAHAPLVVHVNPLCSISLLHLLRYLGLWDNQDKGAIYTGKYWAKHKYKTLGFIKFKFNSIQIGIL